MSCRNQLECPILSTIAMISDKWKVIIIYKLKGGTLRFNELMRALQGVTQKVLTSQLRQLEEDGLVSRKIYAEVPPRVEYSLTPLGESLTPVLEQLEQWAREHSDDLINARARAIQKVSGEKSEKTENAEKAS
ncbi:helix-turn-helix transcriptional regulator [bacterium]|nr:helix-turn-helix transcriptional regulator [bacterium]QQR58386.1 MAG: helix-turn-helix transcriptional regulator [Candidatus Melainabacteria bacterium]